jgi:hypothetical protein
MTVALRALAVLIALAGVADPSWTIKVSRPAPVEVILPATSDPDYARALSRRQGVLDDLHGAARFDGAEEPTARVAIGHPRGHFDPNTPFFAVPLSPRPLEIESLQVPERSLVDQQVEIAARLRGRGMEGHTSAIQLRVHGVTVAATEHRWNRADETHTELFTVPALPEGTHRLQVTVATNGDTVVADASVAVSGRPLRVLVYEPRPSWPVTFARRSLEADPRIELSTLARSAPRIATTSGEPGAPLNARRLNTYDALVLGGLDALSNTDVASIVDFVTRRGGALLLLPDGRIPDDVRTRFGLPALEEVLLQEPALLESGRLRVRASELLMTATDASVTAMIGMQRDGAMRPVVFNRPLGHGSVIFSGVLDAWRYRSTPGQNLDAVVRTVIADAAAAAPPPITVTLGRSVEQPGEPVPVLVAVRETEFMIDGGSIDVPPVLATMIDERGNREMIRLWPTSRIGELRGHVTTAREGRYLIEAAMGSRTAEAVLTIAADVTHPRNHAYPVAAVAALTGGAVDANPEALQEKIAALGATEDVRHVHPMHSVWWMVPFVALLSAEWILRRRAGLR